MIQDTPERWLPVVGWEPYYMVSDWGRIRSLMPRSHAKGGLLKPQPHPSGHLHVSLYGHSKNGTTRKIHQMVMEAFVGPCPPGQEVRHLDGNPANNHLANLTYGTRVENREDQRRHGTHWQTRKTHCANGHEFTPGNTYWNPRGGRGCKECSRANARKQAHKKTARERAERAAQVVHCEWCGKRFSLTRKDRKFCSARCKNAASLARRHGGRGSSRWGSR